MAVVDGTRGENARKCDSSSGRATSFRDCQFGACGKQQDVALSTSNLVRHLLHQADPMPKRPSHLPTEAEMEILVLLWRDGPLTAGDVQRRLALQRSTGYTTALKILQIMYEKKFVRRDESERAHRYRAAVTEERIQTAVVNSLADQLFSGSVARLAMRAIASSSTKAADRAEIRRLLAAQERKK